MEWKSECHCRFFLYLGKELDVIADVDKVELLVELENVHPAPRAPGVEDHDVPPRRSWSYYDVVLNLHCRSRLIVGIAALPAKKRDVAAGGGAS